MAKPLISSRSWRLTHLYKILTKDKRLVTFKPNPIQEKLLEYKRECREAKKPIRFIVLKARQGWVTTEEVIDALDEVLFYKNVDATITAHNIGKSQEIFRIAKYAYDKLPDKILMSNGSIWEKPKAKYASKTELFFEKNNSRIKIVRDTRSITPSRVHITELAFMQDAQESLTAIEWGIPDSASISFETTANWVAWVGSTFYNLWKDNYNKPWALYKTFFFPWYYVEEYQSDLPLKTLDKDYYRLEIERYQWRLERLELSEQKISWYLQKAKKLWREVEQEFPIAPEDAFMATNNSVFDIDYVRQYESITNALMSRYIVDSMYEDLRFFHIENGLPKPEKDIVVGVDVAEWIMSWDYSAIVWRSRKDNKLLFTYRGHIKPDLLPWVLDRIYKYGYQWLIGIERNNHWHAALVACQDYPFYYDLYAQKTLDRKLNKETKKLWWATTSSSKVIMISNMESLIRKWELNEFEQREYGELFTFIYGEDWSMWAISPDHDDMIIADAICLQMSLQGFDSVA